MRPVIKRLSLLLTVAALLLLSIGSSVTFCSDPNRLPAQIWELIEGNGNARRTPRWSPDGTHIVFSNLGFFQGDTYVVTADGTNLCMISVRAGDGTEIDYSPDFSPDGNRIVYATTRHWVNRNSGSIRSRNFEIETIGVDGSDPQRLTHHQSDDVSPAWSPDGSRIAFISHYSYDKEAGIYTMAPDGSDQRLVVRFRSITNDEDPATDLYSRLLGGRGPVWSPDGKKLAYVLAIQERNPNQRRGHKDYTGQVLYTVNADGTELKELFAVEDRLTESITTEPAWSPDSQRIAFAIRIKGPPHSPGYYTIRADGSDLTELGLPHQQIPGIGVAGFGLFWSPDGSEILMAGSSYSGVGYYIWNLNAAAEVAASANRAQAPWSPDGSRIVQLYEWPHDAARTIQHPSLDPYIVLTTAALDGSDLQVLVRIDEEGNLTAGNPQK